MTSNWELARQEAEREHANDLVERLTAKDAALAKHIERIAISWFEKPCDPRHGEHCNSDLHDWDTGHPDDKKAALETVSFILALDKVYTIIDEQGGSDGR